MLNVKFFCDFKADASFIWPHKYFSNPFPSPYFSLFLPLSFFPMGYCNSFLTGTMLLFSLSPNLFFILCQSAFLKYKSVHFISLLKILQWFPVAHKMKFKLLIMAHPSSGSCLHFQHYFLLLSIPLTTFQQHWTVYGFWKLTRLSKLLLLEFSPSLEFPSLLVCLVNPYLSQFSSHYIFMIRTFKNVPWHFLEE